MANRLIYAAALRKILEAQKSQALRGSSQRNERRRAQIAPRVPVSVCLCEMMLLGQGVQYCHWLGIPYLSSPVPYTIRTTKSD